MVRNRNRTKIFYGLIYFQDNECNFLCTKYDIFIFSTNIFTSNTAKYLIENMILIDYLQKFSQTCMKGVTTSSLQNQPVKKQIELWCKKN